MPFMLRHLVTFQKIVRSLKNILQTSFHMKEIVINDDWNFLKNQQNEKKKIFRFKNLKKCDKYHRRTCLWSRALF
jgi:hypothetical protein